MLACLADMVGSGGEREEGGDTEPLSVDPADSKGMYILTGLKDRPIF